MWRSRLLQGSTLPGSTVSRVAQNRIPRDADVPLRWYTLNASVRVSAELNQWVRTGPGCQCPAQCGLPCTHLAEALHRKYSGESAVEGVSPSASPRVTAGAGVSHHIPHPEQPLGCPSSSRAANGAHSILPLQREQLQPHETPAPEWKMQSVPYF